MRATEQLLHRLHARLRLDTHAVRGILRFGSARGLKHTKSASVSAARTSPVAPRIAQLSGGEGSNSARDRPSSAQLSRALLMGEELWDEDVTLVDDDATKYGPEHGVMSRANSTTSLGSVPSSVISALSDVAAAGAAQLEAEGQAGDGTGVEVHLPHYISPDILEAVAPTRTCACCARALVATPAAGLCASRPPAAIPALQTRLLSRCSKSETCHATHSGAFGSCASI